jgi:hypothetical protein
MIELFFLSIGISCCIVLGLYFLYALFVACQEWRYNLRCVRYEQRLLLAAANVCSGCKPSTRIPAYEVSILKADEQVRALENDQRMEIALVFKLDKEV